MDCATLPQTTEPADQPLVSIIIPCVNGLPAVLECVESFVNQDEQARSEVLVLNCCGEETRQALAGRFPRVQVIPVEGRPSIPALRTIGIAHARGRILAMTEDHCIARPRWLAVLFRAWAEGCRAVGGPVENGSPERLVDWGVYFCEYARFMGPMPRGPVPEIPGNNCAFDRAIFTHLTAELEGEYWESFWFAQLRAAGVVFHGDPDMVVDHKKSFGFRYFLTQRYHYSRSFAGMRLHGAAWWKRVGYACATSLLPVLLLARIAGAVLSKRRHVRKLAQCLPILLAFLLSWAVGEAVGALLGPGHSLRKVE